MLVGRRRRKRTGDYLSVVFRTGTCGIIVTPMETSDTGILEGYPVRVSSTGRSKYLMVSLLTFGSQLDQESRRLEGSSQSESREGRSRGKYSLLLHLVWVFLFMLVITNEFPGPRLGNDLVVPPVTTERVLSWKTPKEKFKEIQVPSYHGKFRH